MPEADATRTVSGPRRTAAGPARPVPDTVPDRAKAPATAPTAPPGPPAGPEAPAPPDVPPLPPGQAPAVGSSRARSAYIDRQVHPTGGQVFALKLDGYRLITAMAALGRNVESIAAALGISGHTFVQMRKRDPEAQAAVDRGRAALGDELIDILLEHSRNGHVIAAIYMSKTVGGLVEGQPLDGRRPGVVVNIQIPAAMSDQQFATYIEGHAVEVPADADDKPKQAGVTR